MRQCGWVVAHVGGLLFNQGLVRQVFRKLPIAHRTRYTERSAWHTHIDDSRLAGLKPQRDGSWAFYPLNKPSHYSASSGRNLLALMRICPLGLFDAFERFNNQGRIEEASCKTWGNTVRRNNGYSAKLLRLS